MGYHDLNVLPTIDQSKTGRDFLEAWHANTQKLFGWRGGVSNVKILPCEPFKNFRWAARKDLLFKADKHFVSINFKRLDDLTLNIHHHEAYLSDDGQLGPWFIKGRLSIAHRFNSSLIEKTTEIKALDQRFEIQTGRFGLEVVLAKTMAAAIAEMTTGLVLDTNVVWEHDEIEDYLQCFAFCQDFNGDHDLYFQGIWNDCADDLEAMGENQLAETVR